MEPTQEPPVPHPSPFYALDEGATEVTLRFPADADEVGPYWDDQGNLDPTRAIVRVEEEVRAVGLGAGRYRLAEKLFGPFTGLRLEWGDEFLARRVAPAEGPHGHVTGDQVEPGCDLELLQVVMPRPYRHYGWFITAPFDNADPLAALVHRHGGGWETVAKGLLKLSVPTGAAAQFERDALAELGMRMTA